VIKKPMLVIFLLPFALADWHCIQTYVSPFKSSGTGYLVVEGYILGNAPTFFRLTRTFALPGDSSIPAVTGAQLQLEGTDNSISRFTETGNGYYTLPSATLTPDVQYRLRISNVSGETYLSDYVPYKPTPPIDSVNWTINAADVGIFVSTHDPTNNTRYYQWKYNETWEINSGERSDAVFQGDTIATRLPSQQIYTCWHTDSSSSILVATSDKNSQDVIFEQPLVYIPVNTQQIGIEYSVLVSQYSLTNAAYNYLTLMKSNTEQLGFILGPLPTELVGNIHSLSNASEPVVGYISAGTIQQQRIFILRSQVPDWLWFFECPYMNRGFPTETDSLIFYFGSGLYTPVDNHIGLVGNYTSCVDCRDQDGWQSSSNQKPSFWQ
jgi:hypothetical protein